MQEFKVTFDGYFGVLQPDPHSWDILHESQNLPLTKTVIVKLKHIRFRKFKFLTISKLPGQYKDASTGSLAHLQLPLILLGGQKAIFPLYLRYFINFASINLSSHWFPITRSEIIFI